MEAGTTECVERRAWILGGISGGMHYQAEGAVVVPVDEFRSFIVKRVGQSPSVSKVFKDGVMVGVQPHIDEQVSAAVEIDEAIVIEVERLPTLDRDGLLRKAHSRFHGDIREVSGAIVNQEIGLRRVLAPRGSFRRKAVVRVEDVQIA